MNKHDQSRLDEELFFEYDAALTRAGKQVNDLHVALTEMQERMDALRDGGYTRHRDDCAAGVCAHCDEIHGEIAYEENTGAPCSFEPAADCICGLSRLLSPLILADR